MDKDNTIFNDLHRKPLPSELHGHSGHPMRPVQPLEAQVEQDEDKEEPAEPSWLDRHSVNCFFCEELVDERECTPADELNMNQGGSCCPTCRRTFNEQRD